jgi:hypothetical protein
VRFFAKGVNVRFFAKGGNLATDRHFKSRVRYLSSTLAISGTPQIEKRRKKEIF